MGVDIQTYRAKIGTFKHSFGADVVTFVVVVNFSHGIKTVGSVLFIGLLLIIAGIEPNPGPSESGNTQSTKIKVTGLPKRATAEILTLFFENVKRQGGGKVKEVTVDNVGNSAIVEFENAAAVERVMVQQPVKILQTEVNIEVYRNTQSKKIKVTGIPKRATAEILTLFFENVKRQGGGKVKEVTVDNIGNSAIVEFENAAAVERVMVQQPVKILQTEVNIEVYPDTNITRPTKIKVSGIPDSATDDVLIMFFENEKQGGGTVKCVTMFSEKHCAIIEFEEAEAVEFVLQNQPLSILGTQVSLEAITHEKEDITDRTNKIKVSGLPVEAVDEDILLMYFENEEKGGGKVKEVYTNKEECSAIIEFEETNAVETVLLKRPIRIENKDVSVDIFYESVEPKSILVTCLPNGVTQEYLVTFFENKHRQGGGKVNSVELHSDGKYAVIEFDEPKAVDRVLQNRPIRLRGSIVNVCIFKCSNCVEVKGFDIVDSLEKDLLQFFKNSSVSCGGDVSDMKIDRESKTALVTFESEEEDKSANTLTTVYTVPAEEPCAPETYTYEPKRKSVRELTTDFSRVIEEMSSADRTVLQQSQVDTIHKDKGDDSLFSRQVMPALEGLVSQGSTHTTEALPGSFETRLQSVRARKPEKLPIPAAKPRHILSASRCSTKPGNPNGETSISQFVKKPDMEMSCTSEEKEIKPSNDDKHKSGDDSVFYRQVMPTLESFVSQGNIHRTGALPGSLESARVRKHEKQPIQDVNYDVDFDPLAYELETTAIEDELCVQFCMEI